MMVFTRLGGRGSVGVRGMIVFTRLGGGRGSVGVRGMILFTRLGGGRFFLHGRDRLCRH